jgi:gamma-glutamylcyclotransferase (GGCT)/AIG2-like uncharacterized protein YtfP
MPLLLVYGTLRKFHHNHRAMGLEAHGNFLETLRVPNLSLFAIGRAFFPGVVRDEEGTGVVCELYEVENIIIPRLDGYEGYDASDLGNCAAGRWEGSLPLPVEWVHQGP